MKIHDPWCVPGVLILSLSLLQGEALRVEALEEVPPVDLPEAVLEVLEGPAFRVIEDGELLADVWIREDLPLRDSPSGELGVAYGQIQTGTFVGVVRFARDWSDYRNLRVRPGTYSLRYAVQPADGAHMGVSFFRDFVLLGPADQDAEPNRVLSYDQAVALANKVSGTPHPFTLALFPVHGVEGDLDLVQNDIGQPTVVVRIGGFHVGFVLEGHGEVEGH